MASILSRLSSLVPDFRPFRTPAARGTVRPRPSQDEKIATRAGVGRTWFLPYADSTATDDTPDIRAAMRKMLRDPYIKSAWLSQLLSVLSQPIQVHTPKGKKNRTDQGRADFVRHCLEHAQDGMLGVGTAILMNHGSDGYTVSEKVWQTDARGKYANKVTLRALKPKDLDEHGRLIGDEHNNVTGVWSSRTNDTYPITDFVYTRYLHTFDEPMGMAAFRPSYGAYWARDTVRKLRIIHKEKNLDGLLMGTYEDPADKGPLEAALARARSSTWLSIPAGVRVEMLSKSQAAEGDYKSFDESLREESLVGIALAHLHILQGGVSDARGNTKVHKAVADLGPWLLTYIIQYAINRQIVPDLIDYNYGYSDEYPQVTLGGVSNAEVIELLQVLEGAQRAGFKPSKSYYATELTIQEADPNDPEDLLTPPAAGGMGGPGGGMGGMDLGGMPGGPFGGGGGAGGGLPPGPPALPPAPTAGGEFGAFREVGPAGGYEQFGWDDWKQEAGGKWKSPGGRVLSDAVFQRMKAKGGGGGGAGAKTATAKPAVQPTAAASATSAKVDRTSSARNYQGQVIGSIATPQGEAYDVRIPPQGEWRKDYPPIQVRPAGASTPWANIAYMNKSFTLKDVADQIRGSQRTPGVSFTFTGDKSPAWANPEPAPQPAAAPAYTLGQREYQLLKRRLTAAKNTNDPAVIRAEVRRAKDVFKAKGYPDDWTRWERAADDADSAARRSAGGSWASTISTPPPPVSPPPPPPPPPEPTPFRPLASSGVKLPKVLTASLYAAVKPMQNMRFDVNSLVADTGMWTDMKAAIQLPPAEKEKYVGLLRKGGWNPSERWRMPPMDQVWNPNVTKTENTPPAKVVGFKAQDADDTTRGTDQKKASAKVLLAESDDNMAVIDVKYSAAVVNRYPDAEFRLVGRRTRDEKPVVAYSKGQPVALIMPMGNQSTTHQNHAERPTGGLFDSFGETGHIETFGWDDWQPRDQYMVSPGGRVLKRDTWERMKAKSPQGGGATCGAAGR